MLGRQKKKRKSKYKSIRGWLVKIVKLKIMLIQFEIIWMLQKSLSNLYCWVIGQNNKKVTPLTPEWVSEWQTKSKSFAQKKSSLKNLCSPTIKTL